MITVGIEKWPKTRGTIANRSTRLKRPSWNRFPAITYTCLIFRFSRGKKGGRVCGKDPTPFSPAVVHQSTIPQTTIAVPFHFC